MELRITSTFSELLSIIDKLQTFIRDYCYEITENKKIVLGPRKNKREKSNPYLSIRLSPKLLNEFRHCRINQR
jgi:hypothetical protein